MDDRRGRFERIYEDNSHLILGYALRRTDDAADAADVVADTFLVAWRRLDDVPEGERARLWLYGTARRVLANHYRSRRRARRLSEKLQGQATRAVEDLAAGLSHPSGDAIAVAFGQLKDDDQEVLLLVSVEGLDRDQAAEVMGCSRANLRVRLHRARRRFNKELERAGVNPQRSSSAGHDVGRRATVRPDPEEAQ